MHDLFVVGIADDFGDLPDQIQLEIDTERVLALREKVVETNAQRIMLEDQRGTDFVFGVAIRLQDAGMLERLQQLELSQGRPFVGLTGFGGLTGPHEIQPNAPL